MAYETIQAVKRNQAASLPVVFFAAAVSPPHIYAEAVAKLYRAQGNASQGPQMVADVLDKLRRWRELPRELVMQVTSEYACMSQSRLLLHDALLEVECAMVAMHAPAWRQVHASEMMQQSACEHLDNFVASAV